MLSLCAGSPCWSGSLPDSLRLDEFGQNSKGTWAGKVSSIEELRQFDKREVSDISCLPTGSERDQFMAWNAQPAAKRKATGFFRTEEIDGRWWLIAPNGNLFYSTGLDCVGLGLSARLDQSTRKHYTWLPEVQGEFSSAIGQGTVNFYRCNLIRKWGNEGLEKRFVERTLERMKSWGFTSLGNWSDERLQAAGKIPYTSMGPPTWSLKVPYIAGDICDVFDGNFKSEAHRVAQSLKRSKDDAWLIGYFLDNELPWYSLVPSLQELKPDAPARRVWLGMLKEKYKDIHSLNQAWHAHARSFETLECPYDDAANAVAKSDMAAYRATFADRFYGIWCEAMKAADPHHLILGSRHADRYPEVIAACGKYSDVVSFNQYSVSFDRKKFDGYYKLCRKPFLIGEYAFDSLDAGLLAAFVPVANQQERGRCYEQFSNAVADTSYFVGAHYFQYIDEPVTGRTPDKENSFNGFVSVVDVPYSYLVKAAQSVNSRIYDRHNASNTAPRSATD